MAGLELPFQQGTTYDSGSLGSVPANLIGSVYHLNDGTVLQLCKNADAAALAGSRCVRINSTAGSALVNEASGAADIRYYGVSDPLLLSAGVTVPVNALFYVQKAGTTRISFGNSVAAGQAVTTHATDGHVASVATSLISGVTVTTTVPPAQVGVTLAAVASGAVGRVLMRSLI